MNRIFVEKRSPHDAEANYLLNELREAFELRGLGGVRVLQRYTAHGLTEETFSQATTHILTEPQIDHAGRVLKLDENESAFAVAYLPGQFDQRADSAGQCIEILTGSDRPEISCAKVIVLQGSVSAEELAMVKNYVINQVDSHEVPVVDDELSQSASPVPEDVEVLENFTLADPAELRNKHGLAMSVEDVTFCQTYFRDEESRQPTITEIRMLDTYWSDHCRHTTFLTKIKDIAFSPDTEVVERAWQNYLAVRSQLHREDKVISLMDIALIGMRELRASGELDNLEISDEVNAASIIVPVEISNKPAEDWLVMFKNETHNHPTEIEPFGGAATCLGGCIRDPLSGRAYVYQAMRVTGAANPLARFSETLPGKLPQKKICQVAAQGYASYGNQIGLATGQVAEVYHSGYVAKRLEIGAVVAAAPRSQVFRGKPATGDVILLIGGRTGRDGVGGATGSSKEHGEDALQQSAEVQKGNAPTERKIQRLFRNPELARKIKVCNDFGAGGVAVAIGEIAPSLEIDLDAVPKKYDGLDGTELAISESQERMAICVDLADVAYFIEQSDRENLECVQVARVTNSGRLIMRWRGKVIVDLSRQFLDTAGVQQEAMVQIPSIPKNLLDKLAPASKSLLEQLGNLKFASQRGLGEMFDGSVGAGTVLWPFGGENQITPPDAMVAKLPILDGETETTTTMAWAFDPDLSSLSPFHGAAYAVAESACKAVAAGANLTDIRLTLQEYFPKLGNDPLRWGMPCAALLGAFHAQHMLRIAAIGGKDSMSGSFKNLDVPPTLVSFAVAPSKVHLTISPEFKQAGHFVSLLEIATDADDLPDFEQIKKSCAMLAELNARGAISALHQIGSAGISVALTRMALGNSIGFQASTDFTISESLQPRFLNFLIEHAEPLPHELGACVIGQTMTSSLLEIAGESHPLDCLRAAWEATLEPIYPTSIAIPDAGRPLLASVQKPISFAPRHISKCAKPRVLIPTFPGTNSEYDSAKAFRQAGADAQILVFRNLSPKHLQESLDAMAKAIRESHIFMIPGGFSAGDEPDGSAKFIATVLRNPQISDALMDLTNNRDGLILGICNGFQALIKTGLVPYGEIRPPCAAAPTLVHNSIGRHISRYVHTRVIATGGPWLHNCTPGEIQTVPISHGEGRFLASAEVIDELSRNGQIATQYCTADGEPSMAIEINPNSSTAAIEGITSPCGKIFGKMAHSERSGTHIAQNIPGQKIPRLFAAGVAWFTDA
ncbi:MAG: phosphoribosylformylglycinamidine synthase [Verrucomicrobia bacterium]|nr:MAG: phosphoribosylformylglycinamidine synthase [Verrucomicrobiota bacterium]